MLFTEAARDLYASNRDRWASIQAWLSVPANASAAAKVRSAIAPLYTHWQSVDSGMLSDSDAMQPASVDLDTAEQQIRPLGYVFTPPPTDDAPQPAGVGQMFTGHRLSDGPSAAVGKKFGLDLFAGPGGVPALDVPMWAIAIGSIAAIGGIGYVTWKVVQVAAPIVIAAYAPGALPVYAAYQRGEDVKPHVLKAVEEEQSRGR